VESVIGPVRYDYIIFVTPINRRVYLAAADHSSDVFLYAVAQ
jgi:hypothetical protein